MSAPLDKWIEAAVIVANAENMSDDEVIPTWPDFCVERFPDRYPQLTVGALRAFWAARAPGTEPVAWATTVDGEFVTASLDKSAEQEWAKQYQSSEVVPLYSMPPRGEGA